MITIKISKGVSEEIKLCNLLYYIYLEIEKYGDKLSLFEKMKLSKLNTDLGKDIIEICSFLEKYDK